MLRKKIKKILPQRKHLVENKSLKIFGKLIHNPNLWHLTRHSAARAFAVGLFCAWLPIPFQMVVATAGAILFHANLPISVLLVWVTNPITMPPMFWFAYYLGSMVLNTPEKAFNFEISLTWFTQTMQNIWQPFLLGCLICGLTSAILGKIFISNLWRLFIIRSWKARKLRYKNQP